MEKEIKESITSVKKKIATLEERYALGEIDRAIFDKFSAKYKKELKGIEKLNQTEAIKSSNLEKYINFSLDTSANLCKSWELGSFRYRQKLQNLGSQRV